MRRALRDLQRASGALRDEEVLLKLLASLRVDHGEEQAWIESRKRRENRLRGALRRMVRAGEIDRGRTLLAAMLVFPIKPSRDKRLAKCARRAVDEALRQVEEHRAAPIDDSGALHQLRIAYKRLRYTVETFADALPADLVALGQAAARFQGRLGDLHDADVAIACAKRARLLSDSGRAALVFELTRVRAQRASASNPAAARAAAIAPAPFRYRRLSAKTAKTWTGVITPSDGVAPEELDPLKDDVLRRFVACRLRHVGDLADHVDTRHRLPEHGMLVVQVRCRALGDEKLRPIRGGSGVGHRHHPRPRVP